MKIGRIYITHTCYCSGWDLDGIFEGTLFRKAIRTNQRWEEGVKMLDWDFRKPKWAEHIRKVKEYDFECVMAPDVHSEKDVDFVVECADKLSKYCDRVVIPIHYYDERLRGYELAYPNALKFNKTARANLEFISEFAEQVTHILGGSPHSQLKLAKYFPNLKSLDGNLIFWCAVHYGKYWDGKWVKPNPPLTNEECFKLSVYNLDRLLSSSSSSSSSSESAEEASSSSSSELIKRARSIIEGY